LTEVDRVNPWHALPLVVLHPRRAFEDKLLAPSGFTRKPTKAF
jgi:hypothetical protein